LAGGGGVVQTENPSEISYISVTELNKLMDKTLQQEVGQVRFEGEISQLTRAASGHVYFTIKDEESQVSAVMWRGLAGALAFQPVEGSAVLCHGQPNVYHKNGRLQIVLSKMLPAGEGDLRKRFLQLKEKLEKEGLFAPERKRPLPFMPRAVGLVTSSTGAVVHDIMVKLRERMPQTAVHLVDVRVQGEGAAEDIARGVDLLNRSGLVEVIIVARGGGSLQDLWAFNEEVVVRAVFGSKVPVISAVGHEVDVSLSDLAADVRAPTPTAAAEMVVPKRSDLLLKIAELERRLSESDRWLQPLGQSVDELAFRLERKLGAVIEEGRLHLQAAEAKLKALRPERVIAMFHSWVELQCEKLQSALRQRLSKLQGGLDAAESRLRRSLSMERLRLLGEQVAAGQGRLQRAAERTAEERRHSLEKLVIRLESIDPRRVLKRGYAIVQKGGEVVKSSAKLELRDRLEISLAAGRVEAEVTEKLG
jgi:exodeoxyribonuclease VII large subunit